MAAFIEKFKVTRHEYMHKLSIPLITLMAIDSPKVMYGKLKKYSDQDMNEAKEKNSKMKVTTYSFDELIN